jgi:hypothetical protein
MRHIAIMTSHRSRGWRSAPIFYAVSPTEATAIDGVRLLSHRPSVLYKVEHLATEPVAGDIAVEGLVLTGPGWNERLRNLLKAVSPSERACLFALRLSDSQGLPLPAETLLDRSRTDWFPEFLSHGQMRPHFQPIVDLASGRAYGREALMRGRLGAVEVRGGELVAAAEAPRSACRCFPRARCCSSTSTRARRWTPTRLFAPRGRLSRA